MQNIYCRFVGSLWNTCRKCRSSLKPHRLSSSFSTYVAMASSSKISMANRLAGTDKNVWVVFGKLATEEKALNLGQGFPDFHPPSYVTDALANVASSSNAFLHQYTRSFGHPRLVKALADTFSPIYGHPIDANEEILISVGAYGALFSAVQGLVNPGDECIIIEPFFDCYEPMVNVAGGKPVFIPLRQTKKQSNGVVSSGDYCLDPDELASKFNKNTKLIFLNTPNNPLGKVYTREELQMIADLCQKWDVVVIADEVYEWLIYKPNQHIKIATLPGMWERTITIGSAGKTFSATGWKLGWTIGPKHLMAALQTQHQNCTYTCPTPLQEAVAIGCELELGRIGHPDCYFQTLPQELEPKRDRLAKILQDVGMTPIIPEGGYFMIADYTKLDVDLEDSDEPKDWKFTKWMTRNKKLSAIPSTAFYTAEHRHLSEHLIRFTFIKKDETLDKAEQIVKQWANA